MRRTPRQDFWSFCLFDQGLAFRIDKSVEGYAERRSLTLSILPREINRAIGIGDGKFRIMLEEIPSDSFPDFTIPSSKYQVSILHCEDMRYKGLLFLSVSNM